MKHIVFALSLVVAGLAAPLATAQVSDPVKDPVHADCGTDLDPTDGDAYASCVAGLEGTDCMPVIWGTDVGPVFVGGYHSCNAGVWYDEDAGPGLAIVP